MDRTRRITLATLIAMIGLSHSLHSAEQAPLKTEVDVTPNKPFVLPGQTTAKVVVGKETIWEGRKRFGAASLLHGDLNLPVALNTVIAAAGYYFQLSPPHDYTFGTRRKSDMIFTFVDSCKMTVLSEKKQAPMVQLKPLKGLVALRCDNKQSSQLKRIRGLGKHFVAVRVVGRTEIYKRHPSKVLGTGMDVIVVNNFGAKKIRLEYMQEQLVTIGPETVAIQSVNFDYETKSVDLRICTQAKAPKGEALIIEYGDASADQ